MKKRHIITLAIVATLISGRNSIPNPDHNEDPGRAATQDTTDINVEFEANGWEGAIDADFTITGQPTE